jgi:phosphatidylethanolamine/phosphatidyl-N-methylethanolamine N-methyltransferase
VVFDKFAPEGGKSSPLRRVINWFSTLLGTDITRRFGDLSAGAPCTVTRDEPSLLRGTYRVILLQKTS